MSEKETRYQRSVARRTEEAERLDKIARNPETPWLIGKIAALESWRQRPRFQDAVSRSHERLDAAKQKADQRRQADNARLAEAFGQLERVRNGEPRRIPESEEVIRFAAEQLEVDAPPQPPGEQVPPEQNL